MRRIGHETFPLEPGQCFVDRGGRQLERLSESGNKQLGTRRQDTRNDVSANRLMRGFAQSRPLDRFDRDCFEKDSSMLLTSKSLYFIDMRAGQPSDIVEAGGFGSARTHGASLIAGALNS